MTVLKFIEKKRAHKLKCKVQNYDWGRIGKQSEVGRLYSLQSNTALDEKPYAELWMGTHESGPSQIEVDGSPVLLKDWLFQNPQAVGDKVVQLWGPDLPFLFKVLSVAKALSIQAHPDKKLAKKLHQLQPNIYKDANHKPEMALAISPFEALCGFVSPVEVKEVVEAVPELQCVLGESVAKALMNLSSSHQNKEVSKVLLRAAFTAIMSATEEAVNDALFAIMSRLDNEQQGRPLTSKEKLVLRLADQYPGDVGVLSAFFLNHVCLAPGEALYLDANEPHAYIAGECVECMATSDNVVRAGLTPKYRDTETLCSMLTYTQGPPNILRGVPVYPFTKRYAPPFEEFEVDLSIIPNGQSVILPSIQGPSVFLILEGEGVMTQGVSDESLHTANLRRGDIYFVPAGVKLDVMSGSDSEEGHGALHLYRAGVSSEFFVDSDVKNHVDMLTCIHA